MPSSSTVHAPQSPESQPFLTSTWPCSRREVRRHLAGGGLARSTGRRRSILDHPHASSSRTSSASTPRDGPTPVGGAVRVVVPVVDAVERAASSPAVGTVGKREPVRAVVAAVTVSDEPAVVVRPADHHRPGPAVPGTATTRRNAVRAAQRVAPEIATDRSTSPGASDGGPHPGDQLRDRHPALTAVRRPHHGGAVQRGAQRGHRPGRQRQADVAADRRHVPDLERRHERRGSATMPEQRQPGGRPSSAIVQVAAISRPSSVARQRRPAERGEVDQL